MWNPAGALVQIEVGKAVASAATAPDKRDKVAMMMRDPAPPLGGILTLAMEELRRDLHRRTRAPVPEVELRLDMAMQPDDVLVYWGLESSRWQSRDLGAILKFVEDRQQAAVAEWMERPAMETALATALQCVEAEDFQPAFTTFCSVFYYAALQGCEFEAASALGDAGNVFLRGGDVARGVACLTRAADIALAKDGNVADPNLRGQLSLGAGNALLLAGEVQAALFYLSWAAFISHSAGHSALLCMALIGSAEAYVAMKAFGQALQALEQAKLLVLAQSTPAMQLALSIQEYITFIYREQQRLAAPRLAPTVAAQHTSFLDRVKARLLPVVAESLIGAVICKFVGTAGGLTLSLFGLSQFNINNSQFAGTTVIGNDNLNQVYRR